MTNKTFTQKLWELDDQDLIQDFIAPHRGPRDMGDAHTALTVMQARAAVAAKDTAKATKQLAFATFALAALTLALVLVEVFNVHVRV
jgi:hypothetical protein